VFEPAACFFNQLEDLVLRTLWRTSRDTPVSLFADSWRDVDLDVDRAPRKAVVCE
jgi:hypothetical protein